MSKTVYVLNGPNLNLLGQREPEVYGTTTLSDISDMVSNHLKTLGFGCEFRQTNDEAELVDWIQEAETKSGGIIINAAAYSHTSIAIRDALSAASKPIIEVHLSNIFAREEFRHHSFVSEVSNGVICGLGARGYVLAVDALKELMA